jgi:hypothetical protein
MNKKKKNRMLNRIVPIVRMIVVGDCPRSLPIDRRLRPPSTFVWLDGHLEKAIFTVFVVATGRLLDR